MKTTLTQSEKIRKKTHRLVNRITETILKALEDQEVKNFNSYLADKMSTSRPNISRMFNGEGNYTLKSLLNLAEAAGLEVEIKFYHQYNLKPYEYIQVSSVNIPEHHGKLTEDQYTQSQPSHPTTPPVYLVIDNQQTSTDENILSKFISVIQENPHAYHS